MGLSRSGQQGEEIALQRTGASVPRLRPHRQLLCFSHHVLCSHACADAHRARAHQVVSAFVKLRPVLLDSAPSPDAPKPQDSKGSAPIAPAAGNLGCPECFEAMGGQCVKHLRT
jgi:hypothetical protein